MFGLDTLLGLIVPGLENNVLKELIIEVCVALDLVGEAECEGAINNYWVGTINILKVNQDCGLGYCQLLSSFLWVNLISEVIQWPRRPDLT